MSRNLSIPASYLLVREGERVLLSRRLNTGYMDGYYQLPAGHIESGEMPSAAARRELWEEVGLAVEAAELKFVHAAYREKHNEAHERADFFFELRRWSGEISNREPEKCGGWEWHPIDSLPKDTIPYLKAVLAAIERGEPYSEHKAPAALIEKLSKL